MRDFVADQRGVVIGLAVMIIVDIFVSMIWIATMPSVIMVWDIVVPHLPAQAMGTMLMLNNVMGWTLLILVVGTLVYGLAWATHREPLDVPA